MDLSDYQIVNVIKSYARSMRKKVGVQSAKDECRGTHDGAPSPDESMRKMVFGRIEEIVSEKIKKRET